MQFLLITLLVMLHISLLTIILNILHEYITFLTVILIYKSIFTFLDNIIMFLI